MRLSAGDKLGPYEIIAPIGAGGMGEVYRARDPRLNRDVAIKVSAAQFSERFEREAKAIAALNHPNICQIYDVGPNYLVMEYIEGEAPKGLYPLDEALQIAAQIRDALEAAHEKNIVHRDLKPANIKIRSDGTVKVLDFGLAKALPEPSTAEEHSILSTEAMSLTQAGIVLGTPAYMAPEQASGKEVDKRADIWAFGVVVYEMITGKRLFEGKTVSDVLTAVLVKEPDLTGVDAKVRRLLGSCLQKDPKQRLRDIGDAWRLLEEHPRETGPSQSRLGWVAGTLGIIVAAVFAAQWFTRPAPPLLISQLTVDVPPDTSFTNVFAATAVSPDGHYLVFGANRGSATPSLWLRPLDSLAARPLPGTEGANFPFWSPDSKSIAFFAGGKLKRVELASGAPLVLCDAAEAVGPSVGGTWSRDGIILFGGNDGLRRVPVSGGQPVLLTKTDASRQETGHGYPQFLPDGKRFLYFIQSGSSNTQGVYAGSLDRPQERIEVARTDAKALYTQPVAGRSGYLLWLRDRTLLAQRFDPGKLLLEGDPAPVAEEIGVNALQRAAFWTSDAGLLVYRNGGIGTRTLVWRSRDGKRLEQAGKDLFFNSLRLSPDGKRVAFDRSDTAGQSEDIRLLEFARSVTTRLTFDPKRANYPVWSPDGRQIAFSSNRSGVSQIYRKDAGGGGQEEQLTSGPNDKFVDDWSRDGRYLLYAELNPKTKLDLWALPLDGDRKPVPVLQSPFDESRGQFSPDGKWIAYDSNESGPTEVYIRAFPSSAGKWQISNRGGLVPRWRADGKELFYLIPDNSTVMAVTIRASAASVEADTPRELFTVFLASATFPYDVAADGQRFLLMEGREAQGGVAPLTVVTNWQAGLK